MKTKQSGVSAALSGDFINNSAVKTPLGGVSAALSGDVINNSAVKTSLGGVSAALSGDFINNSAVKTPLGGVSAALSGDFVNNKSAKHLIFVVMLAFCTSVFAAGSPSVASPSVAIDQTATANQFTADDQGYQINQNGAYNQVASPVRQIVAYSNQGNTSDGENEDHDYLNEVSPRYNELNRRSNPGCEDCKCRTRPDECNGFLEYDSDG